MQVKMKGILASPELCADADTVIPVNSELGRSLIEGGYAQEATAASVHETTSLRPSAQAQTLEPVRATDEQIKENLDALDPQNPDHWLGSGKPNPEIVRELTGDHSLTGAELTERFPDFRHPAFKEAVGEMVDLLKDTAPGDEETGDVSDAEGADENTAAKTDGAANSETPDETATDDGEKATEKAGETPAEPAPKKDAATQDEQKPAKKPARGTRSSAP